MPPMEKLRATVLDESSTPGVKTLPFVGSASHFFKGVQFTPSDDDWYFECTNINGDWRSAGPTVSSETRRGNAILVGEFAKLIVEEEL